MLGATGATGGVTVAGGIARGRVRDIGASRWHHAFQKGDLESGGGMRGAGAGSVHITRRITNGFHNVTTRRSCDCSTSSRPKMRNTPACTSILQATCWHHNSRMAHSGGQSIAVNHLHDLVTGMQSLSSLLCAGGCIAGRTASRAARTTYIMSIRGTFRVSHVRIRLRCVSVTQFPS